MGDRASQGQRGKDSGAGWGEFAGRGVCRKGMTEIAAPFLSCPDYKELE